MSEASKAAPFRISSSPRGVRFLGWHRMLTSLWARCLLICLLFAEAPALSFAEHQRQGVRPKPAPSLAEVSRAIAAAARYLEHACGQDGKFIYRIDPNTGGEADSYSIARHAGAMYALATLHHIHHDPDAARALLRAAGFLRRNYIGPGFRPRQLVVWPSPPPDRSYAELGASALGLVALVAAHGVDPKSIPLEELQALGRFVLFLQREDGSFVSEYRADSGPVSDWESLYYPGEAALGLIALYETDHDLQWLNAAARGLSYLAKSRAGLSAVSADHWALIATARLLPHCEKHSCAASRTDLLRHAIQICESILREQNTNPTLPLLEGAFDSTGRTAPTATRLEGLLAALEFVPKEETGLRARIEAASERSTAFLLRAQIKSGRYAGGVPGVLDDDAKSGSAIRIDYVQHALCAWLLYRQLFQPAKR